MKKTLKLIIIAVFTLAFCISGSAQLPVAGNYHGIFSESVGFTHHSAGFIRVTVKPTGAFSGYLLVDGDRVAFAGKNFPTNVTTWSRTNKFGKEPLVVSLVAKMPLEAEQIVGTISNSSWVADVSADRQVWSALNPTTEFVNSFTFAFPGSTNAAAAPAGDSVGWITNYTSGFSKVTGFLADRSTISLKVPISTNGRVPIYVGAYRSLTTYSNVYTHNSAAIKREFLGSLMGWMTITNATTAPTGDLVWIKTAPGAFNKLPLIATNYYPAGFAREVSIVGSIYTPPTIGNWVLNIANGSTLMQDGNLTAPLTNFFTITNTATAKAVFNPPNTIKQTVAFTPKTGRIVSTFYHPVSGLRSISYLVPLQDQNIARGAFLGINQTGSIIIE